MSKSQILGLDIGTQAVKGVVVDLDGHVLARVGLERGPTHPRPGWVEMDADRDWWGYALRVVHHLLREESVAPTRIAAIGVSGLVPCLLPLDAKGDPLRPAILYSDNRALEELAWVNERLGQGRGTVGRPAPALKIELSAEAVIPKLLWLKRHEPEIYNRTKTVLSAHNYVVYRLTGRRSMDYDTANIMGGIFDAASHSWNEDLCQELGLSADLLPPPVAATDIVGHVTAEAARITGLVEGTPVIGGTGDTFPTIVGCGAVEPGDAMIAFGTTGLLTVTRKPLVTAARGPHFGGQDDGATVTWGANVLSAGRLVRWYRDHFGWAEQTVAARTGGDAYDLLEAEAERLPPGAEGLIVLPHLLGRRTPTPDATLRGAILGLSPSHGAAHVYRAILESFAFNVRQGFDEVRSHVERVVATAGGARSQLWRQIVADVLETPIEYHPQSEGALGVAFLAGYAVNLIDDFGLIRNEWLRHGERLAPNPRVSEIYRKLFPVYCEFDEAVAAPFAHLAEVEREK